MDFLFRIFDSSGFPARWRCGTGWADEPWLGWMHILSDLGVWSAYLAIPLVLAFFIHRRSDLPFRKIFLLFGAFIFACGTTHLMEAIIFYWPAYRLAGLIKFMTAVISWITVFALWRVVPAALAMRSPEELQREIDARERAEQELQQMNATLERRVQMRTEELNLAVSELQKERELLKTTLGSIGDGVIVTDMQGRTTFLNGVAENLTGWSNSEAFGVELDRVFQIINESTRRPVENPAIRALNEGTIVGLANHTLLISKDGAEKPIDDSAAPIRSENGVTQGAVLVFRDITDRKHALTQLSRQEERLRLTVDATGLGVFDFAPRTGHQSWSEQSKTIWGFSQESPVTMDLVIQAIHPDDRERFRRVHQASLDPDSRGEFVLEHRLIHPDGTERWVLVRGKTIFDNSNGPREAVRSLGIMIDITERKRAEEALRKSELREKERAAELETVLRATPTPIWISHDRDCHHVTGNPASYKLLQLSEGSNVTATPVSPSHRNFREFRNGVPIPTEELPLQLAARQGIEVKGAELTFVFDNGEVRHLYGNASPLRDRYGSIRGATAAFMDITELKNSEDALRDADRRKDEFLATLAHELRNPLAPISNSIEIMKRAHGDLEVLEKSRVTIERQLRQLVRLVDDLIDVSRVSRNKLELRKERTELAAVVRHVVEACAPLVRNEFQELSALVPDEPIYLYADPVRLSQIFSNLITNSSKYSDRGGRIVLSVEHKQDRAVITVSDNGIGIPPGMLDRIFDMFTQVDQSLERQQSGLGIGLTIVKRLVELHEGTVTARSEGLGHGSEFVVELPMMTETPDMSTSAPPESAPATNKARRILVVDDNRDAAFTLAGLLEMSGNNVQMAHDGEEAVQKAEQFQPEVILLDIGMPKKNGYEVCREIRATAWGRQIFIIALTGWGQSEDRRKSAESGFDEHMVKPIEFDALMAILAKRPGPR